LSKFFDKRIYKKLSPNTLTHTSISIFIESINFRVLYFLFIEFDWYLKQIKEKWKKRKPPLSLSGSGVDIGEAFYSCTDEEYSKIISDEISRETGLDRWESLHLSPAEEAEVNDYLSKGYFYKKPVETKNNEVNLEVFKEIKPEGWTIFEVTGCSLAILLLVFIFYFMFNRWHEPVQSSQAILETSKKKDSPVLPGSGIQDIPDKTKDN